MSASNPQTILAFDCATSLGAVAAVTDGGSGWTARASALMDLIDDVVDDPRAIEGIVVGTGPGSFTSIRIALATAQGLALALDVPVAGSSTLAAFAAPFIAADDSLPVVAAIDARHDHVYLQVFGPGGRTVVSPRVTPLREALRVSTAGAPRVVGTAAGAGQLQRVVIDIGFGWGR